MLIYELCVHSDLTFTVTHTEREGDLGWSAFFSHSFPVFLYPAVCDMIDVAI